MSNEWNIKELPELRTYVVVINGYFTRNTEYCVPQKSSKASLTEDEICAEYEKEENWKRGLHQDLYCGVYTWDKKDVKGLLAKIAKQRGLVPDILSAYEIPCQKEKKYYIKKEISHEKR